jgi:hypothetical protein
LWLYFFFTRVAVSLLVTRLNDNEKPKSECALHEVTTDNRRLEDLHKPQRIEAMGSLPGSVSPGSPHRLAMIFASLETMSFKDENKYQAAMVDPAAEAVRLGGIEQSKCCRSADASLQILSFSTSVRS